MPSFETANRARLEGALAAPRAQFSDFEPYPGLEEKAAVLLYHLVKNHPFPNGNKRFATAAYLVFLGYNGWWPKITKDELIHLVEELAGSDRQARADEIQRVARITRDRLVPVEEAEQASLGLLPPEEGWNGF